MVLTKPTNLKNNKHKNSTCNVWKLILHYCQSKFYHLCICLKLEIKFVIIGQAYEFEKRQAESHLCYALFTFGLTLIIVFSFKVLELASKSRGLASKSTPKIPLIHTGPSKPLEAYFIEFV